MVIFKNIARNYPPGPPWLDSAGPIVKVSCTQKLILTLFFKHEFLPWNRSELAPRTSLVGFSRSDSEGFVYSKIDFDTYFKREFLPWNRSELTPGTPLVTQLCSHKKWRT